MRKVDFAIRKESFDDMRKAGRFNPSLEITFRDKHGTHTHKLGAGYCDDITVYRESSQTYVLTQNSRLGYVALDTFEGPDRTSELFIEPHQIPETIGRDDLAPFTIIRRLLPYI